MSERPQLSLFAGTGPDPAGPRAIVTAEQRAWAGRLPPSLYLGTSSYTFPGWAGVLYAGHPGKDKLVEQGLTAYASHPLLRTVGIDRSYYTPVSLEVWRQHARQLPAGFVVTCKAWSELTTAVFPNHARWGERAGQVNPRFLDPQLALDDVVRPYLDGLGALAGPIVLELPPVPEALSADSVYERFRALFRALPKGLPIAVELRSARLLTPRWLELLEGHGVSHVLNFWSGMPTPAAQAKLGADLPGADLVFRLLQPPGSSYDALAAAYAPFDTVKEPQPQLLADVVALVRRAVRAQRRVFVIVGNKAEGCAPRTVFSLAEALAQPEPCA